MTSTGCGNRCNGPCLIVQADVGVPHRHADVAVASQLTGFDEGCTVSQQFGDVSMTSHCVEVGGSLFGLVRDPQTVFKKRYK